jgi:hypothetical protein
MAGELTKYMQVEQLIEALKKIESAAPEPSERKPCVGAIVYLTNEDAVQMVKQGSMVLLSRNYLRAIIEELTVSQISDS